MSTIQDSPPAPSVTIASARAPALGPRIVRLWTYRNLLLNLTKRDLRIRYKESFLGFLWSLLNPLMYLIIFYIVFVKIVPAGIPNFVVFFLSGLLPWTLFQNTMMGATNSVVGGAPLLKRVSFPREVLPLAQIGANVFQFFLQLLVLLAVLLIMRYPFVSPYLALIIPAFVVEVLLLTGFSLILSSLTVYLRDIAHFMELALLLWFWLTPVVYPVYQVYDKLTNHPHKLFGHQMTHISFSWVLANPMVAPVLAFQRAFYKTVSPIVKCGPAEPAGKVCTTHILVNFPFGWYLKELGILTLVALVLIWIGFSVFGRAEGNFAEEL